MIFGPDNSLVYYISIGSNLPDGESRITNALAWLRNYASSFAASSIYLTPSVSKSDDSMYFNAVARCVFPLSTKALVDLLKDYELRHGRDAEARRRGIVPVDIDIVVANDTPVRSRDFNSEYFQIGYRELLGR